MSTSTAILRQIASLGYVIVIISENGQTEIRATKGDEVQIARCNDGDGEEEIYRAAVLLAEAVGIDLEDG